MRTALLLSLLLAPLSAQPDRFGLPACAGPGQELAPKHTFIICHSASFKAPLWTVHELSASSLAAPLSTVRRVYFRRDPSLSMSGASVADYRNSGFSRGHLVPARDVAHDEQALSDSFLLSNAVPQDSAMNGSIWRRLENRVRKLTGKADSVIVVTGAIFPASAQTIGPGGVAVPSHLYKVVLVNERGRASLFAFIIPNAETSGRSLEEFLVTIAEAERRTGLTFFPSLGQRGPRATEPGIIIAPASVADLPTRASEIERRDAPPTAAPDHAGNSPLENVSSQI